MTAPVGLIDRSLAEFARAAASREPVPGSGCLAAAVGALGAGLASMALASARGEGPAAAARAGVAELTGLMEQLLACVQADAEAYGAFLEARAGRGDLGQAVERSIQVPREIAALALAALEHLVSGQQLVRARLHSELVTAAHSLLACVEGAAFTASANLPALDDAARRAQVRAELAELPLRARALLRTLQATLEKPPS